MDTLAQICDAVENMADLRLVSNILLLSSIYNPLAPFSLFILEVSRSHTTKHYTR